MISIAMAAYNAEKHIYEQLLSIENQSIKPFEIIICNDASIDTTVKIINDFKSKTNIKIQVIDHENNKGYHKAFETAVKNCSGDYIFISDSDDYWFKNKIKDTMKIFNNNLNIDLIINNSLFTDENLKSMKITKLDHYLKIYNNLNYYIPGCNCAFRRKILDIYLPFPKNFIAYDYWLNKIAITYKTRFINKEILQYYRRHESNFSTNNVNNYSSKLITFNILFNKKHNYRDFIKLNFQLKKRILNDNSIKKNDNIIINLNRETKSYITRQKIISSSFIKKIILIYVMIKNNFYFDFFRGYKSAIKDILR